MHLQYQMYGHRRLMEMLQAKRLLTTQMPLVQLLKVQVDLLVRELLLTHLQELMQTLITLI